MPYFETDSPGENLAKVLAGVTRCLIFDLVSVEQSALIKRGEIQLQIVVIAIPRIPPTI